MALLPSTAPNESQNFDQVVVGGGPVGAVLALGLAQQGYRVALVERELPTGRDASRNNALGVDPRTVALSESSKELLDELSAWPAQAIDAFDRMEVWEESGTSVLRFGAQDANAESLGHIAEVGPWRDQLWRQLAALEDAAGNGKVQLLAGTEVVEVAEQAHGYLLGTRCVTDDSQAQIFARTLIAADGANSAVRRALGVNMAITDMQQSALAFAARVERPHEGTAFQRFLRDGPLALLPMADEHLVSVVWSARTARADELAALDTQQLMQALERASEQRLGRVEAILPALRFPLRQGVIESFCPRSDVVFVGDAARVIHPLAGQGVNLGFEDVRALLECTHPDVARNGLPSVGRLQRFARMRRARSRLAVAAMGALSAAYTGQSPALLLARNTVTRTLGDIAGVRRRLVLEAMGLGPVARAR